MSDLPADLRWPAALHYDKARQLLAQANADTTTADGLRFEALVEVLLGLLSAELGAS